MCYFCIMNQRRFLTSFNIIREVIHECKMKTNCPVTNMQVFHSDGQWRLPEEIIDIDYHSYNFGYGKCSHSGYHYYDIVPYLLEMGLSQEKYYDSMEIFSSFVRPLDYCEQITSNDYEKIFGSENVHSIRKYSDEFIKNEVKSYGEIDAISNISFKKKDSVLTNVAINLVHNGYSTRNWLSIGKRDLYQDNGRVGHESYILQQGPFQSIQFHSYKSKKSADGIIDPYSIGGKEHLEIYIFRNNKLIGGNHIDKIDIKDIKSLENQVYGGTTKAKERVLSAFFKSIQDGNFHRVSSIDLLEQLPAVSIMSGIYQSASKYKNGENPITKISLSMKNKNHFSNVFSDQLFMTKKSKIKIKQPFKIKVVEKIEYSMVSDRKKWIKECQYNLFHLSSKQVMVDLLTDSGVSAMSNKQWSKIFIGDEAYAGSTSYFNFEKTAKKIFMVNYIVPVHQGRAAENVLFSALVNQQKIVLSNGLFETTKWHITSRGASTIDCTAENQDIFQGNIDLCKLSNFLSLHQKQVAFVVLTITSCCRFGLPVSMENISSVSSLCKTHGVIFLFDAARFSQNAFFIKMHENKYRTYSIQDIVKKMFSYVDGFFMSAKKDCLVNIGGIIGINKKKVYESMCSYMCKVEGYQTYGGLSGRDLAAIEEGIIESIDIEYLQSSIEKVHYLGNSLLSCGIPVLSPFGGHAIFIDASKFYPNIPIDEHPAQFLAVKLYTYGGIRTTSLGILKQDKAINYNSSTSMDNHTEYVRLAIPRRVYTYDQLDYVIKILLDLYKNKEKQTRGLKITKYSPVSGYVSTKFEKLDK